MKIYDSIINESLKALESYSKKSFEADGARAWTDLGKNELVMQREAAYELGGSGLDALNYTCVTSSDLVDRDEVLLVGPDLNEIKQDTPFARISLIKSSDELTTDVERDSLTDADKDKENKAYNMVRNLEFVRYHVYPKGYMIRVSSSSHREQIRVSKSALAEGISFGGIGKLYIQQYKALPGVLQAKVIFVTDPQAVKALAGKADRVEAITKTLDHIMEGLELDCGHCNLKPVCDEVEGMREEHMKALGITPKE